MLPLNSVVAVVAIDSGRVGDPNVLPLLMFKLMSVSDQNRSARLLLLLKASVTACPQALALAHCVQRVLLPQAPAVIRQVFGLSWNSEKLALKKLRKKRSPVASELVRLRNETSLSSTEARGAVPSTVTTLVEPPRLTTEPELIVMPLLFGSLLITVRLPPVEAWAPVIRPAPGALGNRGRIL